MQRGQVSSVAMVRMEWVASTTRTRGCVPSTRATSSQGVSLARHHRPGRRRPAAPPPATQSRGSIAITDFQEEAGPMTNSTAAQFAANLRQARAKSGLSQMQLAEKARLSASQVYRLESGTREPQLRAIVSLGRAMGIDGADLLHGIGEHRSAPE
jgi:ribosome-binding protein aMBF1 (putative translation factor)